MVQSLTALFSDASGYTIDTGVPTSPAEDDDDDDIPMTGAVDAARQFIIDADYAETESEVEDVLDSCKRIDEEVSNDDVDDDEVSGVQTEFIALLWDVSLKILF